MDMKSAHETFYGLFVNSSVKKDSCIATDLQMEHIVRLVKDHLKSVHSNKTEKTMAKRTSALAGMKAIAEQFDRTSSTVIRASKHKLPSADEDELLILKSVLPANPFSCVPGRQMKSFKSPIQCPLKK
jgi:tyrosyl-tRNA synthetase